MATLIPAINSCLRRMTAGERHFAYLLEAKLEEDYYGWYDVSIGDEVLHPDFIILHPGRGLLVLEVKDWRLETLRCLDHEYATILVERGEVRVKKTARTGASALCCHDACHQTACYDTW